MNIILGILAVLLLVLLVAFDFVLIPLAVKIVLSWFGFTLAFWQCLFIVILFNIITCGFRKK